MPRIFDDIDQWLLPALRADRADFCALFQPAPISPTWRVDISDELVAIKESRTRAWNWGMGNIERVAGAPRRYAKSERDACSYA